MRTAAIAIILLCVTMSTYAQMPAEGTTVRITLDGDLCPAVKNRRQQNSDSSCNYPIMVVYNEDDTVRQACLAEPPCTWVWRVREPLNPKLTAFSLRLGPEIGRTRCRRATALDPWTLDVTFTRSGRDPAIKLDIGGPAVYYMRVVDSSPEGDVRCREKRLLASTLNDVQFDIEDIRLQVYKQKAAYCGVMVDDLAARKKLQNDGSASIGPAELAPAVSDQSARGKLCYAPTVLDPKIVEASFRKTNPTFQIKVVK